MKLYVRLCGLIALLLINHVASAGLRVMEPWIKAAPPNARVLAAFLVVENESADAISLIGAESPACKRIEMHESRVENGMARMVPRPRLDIEAHGRLVLSPGGRHLMLINPTRALKEGDTVEMRLNFSNGQSLDIQAVVRAVGHPPHAH